MGTITVLLHLLLMVSGASAWYWHYFSSFGRSVDFTPKGRNSDGTYEVELRQKNTVYIYYHSYDEGTCQSGDCGTRTQRSVDFVTSGSYGLTWTQYETKTTTRLTSNLPFEMRYPLYEYYYHGNGYWFPNVRNTFQPWRMMTHVDMGIRSDTQESNRPPVITTPNILRVTNNCPRSFNIKPVDPDGDNVRCRLPTDYGTYECSICSLPNGFSFDKNSCTLTFNTGAQTGYNPVELVVEDFPKQDIILTYSDGSYTRKWPQTMARRKRQITAAYPTTTTAAETTTTAYPTTTTAAETTTTAYPTTTTAAETTTTAYPTTTTAAETTTTAYPTTTTAAETTTTAYPTTTTAAETTTTAYPTTTTAAETTTTAYPTTTTAAETTTTAYPTTTTAAETTTTAYPTTTTAAETTTTAYPTTTTAAETTTTAYPTTTTAAETTTTAYPTTTTAAETTTTAYPTTTDPYPATTTPPPTTTTTAPTTVSYRSSIRPLSILPLQFTVLVDSHSAPSCVDGDYFPIFVAPTPVNGVNLPAYVNQTLEIKVSSEAQYTTINDLIVTGPQGISKERSSTDTYIIKWTPTEDKLNYHFPICFVSEARDMYYNIYHSELRCVSVDVSHQEAVVTCNETTMTMEVAKTYTIKRKEDKLHLKSFTDSSCDLKRLSNETHLVAVIALGACGTQVQEDEDRIYFQNEITSADPNKIISRQNDVEVAFTCSYPKRANLTLGFRHKNPYAFREKGFGAFTFQFEFFESQRFRKQVNASSYPVEVYLKQMIFMQIEATSSIPTTELFVESCKATPYDNPNSRISYTIIENG
ncbi:mucin-2-like [Poeciliopsis prolifica]|uniref:mucin-2-like n=1 Tax=Poeciliopsis prolifica TaxID=188132 RepID=UPI0024143FF6|nr:mucin-2-like [Poeciliopsis prolifica]